MSLKQWKEKADGIWRALEHAVVEIGENPSIAGDVVAALVEDRSATARFALTRLFLRADPDIVTRLGPDNFANFLIGAWLHLRWRRLGYPVFTLTEALTASLLMTDCASLPAEVWTPPFDPVALLLPSPSVLKASVDGNLRELPLILVGTYDAYGVDPFNDIRSTSGQMVDIEKTVEKMERQRREIRLHHTIRLLPETVNGGYGLSSQTPAWQEGMTFGDWMERHLHLSAGAFASAELTDVDEDALALAWRISMSAWQYLASIEAKTGPREARFSAFQQGKARTYAVGREIKIEAPREVLRTIGTAGWKVHARFMVRGHWRNQAVGTGRVDHRRTWVRPYWKGPKTAQEVLDRSYKVG